MQFISYLLPFLNILMGLVYARHFSLVQRFQKSYLVLPFPSNWFIKYNIYILYIDLEWTDLMLKLLQPQRETV